MMRSCHLLQRVPRGPIQQQHRRLPHLLFLLFLYSLTSCSSGITAPTKKESAVPLLGAIPETSFRCLGHSAGYYADPDTGCQVYHMCDELERQYSYLCPNYTLFNQKFMVCDHWYMVNCSSSQTFYHLNSNIGEEPGTGGKDGGKQHNIITVEPKTDPFRKSSKGTPAFSTSSQPTRPSQGIGLAEPSRSQLTLKQSATQSVATTALRIPSVPPTPSPLSITTTSTIKQNTLSQSRLVTPQPSSLSNKQQIGRAHQTPNPTTRQPNSSINRQFTSSVRQPSTPTKGLSIPPTTNKQETPKPTPRQPTSSISRQFTSSFRQPSSTPAKGLSIPPATNKQQTPKPTPRQPTSSTRRQFTSSVRQPFTPTTGLTITPTTNKQQTPKPTTRQPTSSTRRQFTSSIRQPSTPRKGLSITQTTIKPDTVTVSTQESVTQQPSRSFFNPFNSGVFTKGADTRQSSSSLALPRTNFNQQTSSILESRTTNRRNNQAYITTRTPAFNNSLGFTNKLSSPRTVVSQTERTLQAQQPTTTTATTTTTVTMMPGNVARSPANRFSFPSLKKEEVSLTPEELQRIVFRPILAQPRTKTRRILTSAPSLLPIDPTNSSDPHHHHFPMRIEFPDPVIPEDSSSRGSLDFKLSNSHRTHAPPRLSSPVHSLPSFLFPPTHPFTPIATMKQESPTPLATPLAIPRRNNHNLRTSPRDTFLPGVQQLPLPPSIRGNRDFFIPSSSFSVLVSDLPQNTVEEPSLDTNHSESHHHHGDHMTMVFPAPVEPSMMKELKLNPDCPRCHPEFLKPGDCHPCVVIK